MTFFDNFHSSQLIAAHRGCRAYYPENTISAFNACVGMCHFIELDVRISRDHTPVVFHDATLERTSDALAKRVEFGLQSTLVRDWDLIQLKSLDVGSWFFETDPFGTVKEKQTAEHTGSGKYSQSILTLEEVLSAKSLGQIPINVEIKDHQGWEYNQKVTECILQVIRKTQSEHRVLLSSFNHDYLVIAKSIIPEITTAALQDINHPPAIIEYLKSLGVAAYHPSVSITSCDLVRQLRAAGFGVNVYTVNNKTRQRELFDYGVTAIFTDYPEIS